MSGVLNQRGVCKNVSSRYTLPAAGKVGVTTVAATLVFLLLHDQSEA